MSQPSGAGEDVILVTGKDWPLWIAVYTNKAIGLGVWAYANPDTTLLPSPPDPRGMEIAKALIYGTSVTYGLVRPRAWDFGSQKWITLPDGGSETSSAGSATPAASESDPDARVLDLNKGSDLKLIEDALWRCRMPPRHALIGADRYNYIRLAQDDQLTLQAKYRDTLNGLHDLARWIQTSISRDYKAHALAHAREGPRGSVIALQDFLGKSIDDAAAHAREALEQAYRTDAKMDAEKWYARWHKAYNEAKYYRVFTEVDEVRRFLTATYPFLPLWTDLHRIAFEQFHSDLSSGNVHDNYSIAQLRLWFMMEWRHQRGLRIANKTATFTTATLGGEESSRSKSSDRSQQDCPCGKRHKYPPKQCYLLIFALTAIKIDPCSPASETKLASIRERAKADKYKALVKIIRETHYADAN